MSSYLSLFNILQPNHLQLHRKQVVVTRNCVYSYDSMTKYDYDYDIYIYNMMVIIVYCIVVS